MFQFRAFGALVGGLRPPKPVRAYGTDLAKSRVSHPELSATLEATEQFFGDYEQRHLLNSSAVILQNPIDEQGTTSVERLWKGAANHERLRTTA